MYSTPNFWAAVLCRCTANLDFSLNSSAVFMHCTLASEMAVLMCLLCVVVLTLMTELKAADVGTYGCIKFQGAAT